MCLACYFQPISIHAPREGSDVPTVILYPDRKGFQSTLPVRGATGCAPNWGYPSQISIHAPREGSDVIIMLFYAIPFGFQSTLPVRGATWVCVWLATSNRFQSTLPVRGATQFCRPRFGDYVYFNPRSP